MIKLLVETIKMITRFISWFLKFILAMCIFAIDHIAGIFAGAAMGSLKGLSGMFGMGLRSFGVSMLKKL